MPNLNIGGQAVIEGVMMRSPERVSTACRISDGSIRVKTENYRSLSQRVKALGLPLIRGVITFFEMTVIGVKTLNFSADVAVTDAEKQEAAEKGREYTEQKQKANNLMLALTVIFSLGLGVAIFFFLPLAIADWFGVQRDALAFNLAAGAVRVAFLIGYMSLLTLSKEFRRIFEYHGAEHKAIMALENNADLTPESAARFTRFHPRCGTSFLLIVALLAILVYSIADTIWTKVTGAPPTLWQRLPFHLLILPVVPSISYELLRLSGQTRDNPITKVLIQPGLWLQRITTREPNHEQLEVAIVALEEALARSESALEVKRVLV
ncbi:MAG TPA: DUF1385 domain-containing protein [candidate division Zixibacteria bacterium]|nr:DUF1385 domain-containing protein [candidate division Zixibacteria bacterium]